MTILQELILATIVPAAMLLIFVFLRVPRGFTPAVTILSVLAGIDVVFVGQQLGALLPAIAAGGAARLDGFDQIGAVVLGAALGAGVKLAVVLGFAGVAGRNGGQRAVLAALGMGIGCALARNALYLAHAGSWDVMGGLGATTSVPEQALCGAVLASFVVRAMLFPESRATLLIAGFAASTVMEAAYALGLRAAGPGDVATVRVVVDVLGIGTIFVVNSAVLIARAVDEEAGDFVPDPMRALFVLAGITALGWVAILRLTESETPLYSDHLRALTLLPGVLALDLLRAGFFHGRRREVFERHALRLRPDRAAARAREAGPAGIAPAAAAVGGGAGAFGAGAFAEHHSLDVRLDRGTSTTEWKSARRRVRSPNASKVLSSYQSA